MKKICFLILMVLFAQSVYADEAYDEYMKYKMYRMSDEEKTQYLQEKEQERTGQGDEYIEGETYKVEGNKIVVKEKAGVKEHWGLSLGNAMNTYDLVGIPQAPIPSISINYYKYKPALFTVDEISFEIAKSLDSLMMDGVMVISDSFSLVAFDNMSMWSFGFVIREYLRDKQKEKGAPFFGANLKMLFFTNEQTDSGCRVTDLGLTAGYSYAVLQNVFVDAALSADWFSLSELILRGTSGSPENGRSSINLGLDIKMSLYF